MNTLKQACFVELEQIPKEKLQEVLSYLKQLQQSDEPKLEKNNIHFGESQ